MNRRNRAEMEAVLKVRRVAAAKRRAAALDATAELPPCGCPSPETCGLECWFALARAERPTNKTVKHSGKSVKHGH